MLRCAGYAFGHATPVFRRAGDALGRVSHAFERATPVFGRERDAFARRGDSFDRRTPLRSAFFGEKCGLTDSGSGTADNASAPQALVYRTANGIRRGVGAGLAAADHTAVVFTSCVQTLNCVRFATPKAVVRATSVASRPRAIRTRPMRVALWRGSIVHQRPPR